MDSTSSDTGSQGAAAPVARLGGPRLESDPAGLYDELRRRYGGVAPVLLDGGVPAWLVIGYRELHQVTSHPGLFARDSRRWNAWGRIPAHWPLLPMIGYEHPSVLSAEGAEHKRRAGMISDALAGVDAHELRTDCERFADGLIDAFRATGRADLIAQYAHPLPLLVLARLLGIDEEGSPGLVHATAAMMDGGEDALRAQLYLHNVLRRLPTGKRERPGPDVTSRMAHHIEQYADEELTEDLMVLMAAGHQPTADWIGNTLRLMLTDDRFAARLSGGRRSVGQAMTEVLWREAPIQNFAGRYATRDFRLGKQYIRAGDLLILGIAAANSDPAVHVDEPAPQPAPQPAAGAAPWPVPGPVPGPAEGNQAHLSFSHGEHRCPCPAQDIATAIARAGVEVLLDRLPDVRLAVPEDALAWRPSPWLRGLTALPVVFSPVAV